MAKGMHEHHDLQDAALEVLGVHARNAFGGIKAGAAYELVVGFWFLDDDDMDYLLEVTG